MSQTDEIKAVMVFLGREFDKDGQVRDYHLIKVLDYFIKTKAENLSATLGKLALVCGINQRYIRENYLLGLEGFGIIQIYSNGGQKHWRWVGLPETAVKVKDKKMCESCGMKTPSAQCVDAKCKNVKVAEN